MNGMVITRGCLHLTNVSWVREGETEKVRVCVCKGERERERGTERGLILTARSSFLMKMEDKCFFSLTVPLGRVTVIIPKSKQGS